MNIEKIITLIYDGHSLSGIASIFGVCVVTIRNRIELTLNNPKSVYYNPKEYQKINLKIAENNAKFQEKYRERSTNRFKINAVLLEQIKKEAIGVPEFAKVTHRSKSAVLQFLAGEYEKSYHPVLEKILIEYHYLPEKKRLIDQPLFVQKEILFVIFKFYLSKESISTLFNTDRQDVEAYLSLFPEYRESLEKIDFEKQDILSAKKYYLKRNEIVKILNKAKRNKEQEKIEVYQEKLNELQKDIYAVLLQHRNDLNEEERKIREVLLNIRTLIYAGKLLIEIEKQLSLTEKNLNKILNKINDENSKFYDSKEYEQIKSRIKQNKIARIVANKSKNKMTDDFSPKVKFYIQEIKMNKKTIKEASQELGIGFYTMLSYIKEKNDKEYEEVLQNILNGYSFAFKYESRNYGNASLEKKKEMMDLALSYRISISSLCELYQTTASDIEEVFKGGRVVTYENALDFLVFETEQESEAMRAEAFQKGKYYLDRKKLYLKNLKKALSKDEKEKVEVYQEKINDLRKEILDDETIFELKNCLIVLDEDKLRIVNYRIKYGLSKKQCVELFGINTTTLLQFEDKLMEQNPYYYEKLFILNYYYYEVGLSYKRR